MITREAADLLNKLRSLAFGISGPFLGFSGLRPREGPSGWPFGVAVSVECPMRPVKTWGPVDGRGHAMFGWPMEEEAKLEFTITVNWRREDGSSATTQLGTLVSLCT
jgi:hypothetical protein